jgi:hypothetical protein
MFASKHQNYSVCDTEYGFKNERKAIKKDIFENFKKWNCSEDLILDVGNIVYFKITFLMGEK